MIILGFDTSTVQCAACVMRDGKKLVARADAMSRGQAEHLMPMLEAMLGECGLTWQDLDAIGVGIGPGNFTGIRISVAAARGLALGLNIPAIGVSSFDAATGGRSVPSAIEGPRGRMYLKPVGEDPVLLPEDVVRAVRGITFLPSGADHAETIAREAWLRMLDPDAEPPKRPAPLYIKSADAAPPRDAPPRIIP